ncbi:MAG: hypothetical protein Q8S00_13010 [Deltaproteobacteria bacterium]|nr:hypothetical protein [Deltaproteobacteria bacterium]MDZ4345817.1 hypothetical protein [Candidatus Binatia bacterium]
MNRLPWRLEALNGTTGFSYDANGNLLSVTDPRSNATPYAYVTMDGLATRVDLLTRSESYQYDLAGDMTQLMDRKSKVKKCGRQTNILPAVAVERATRRV